MWWLWLYFNSDAKWKKIASSENGLDLWALSWPPAPHPLWSAFTPTTPRPLGVIREPLNGPVGCQPISHCLFSNQITIFNGDTSPGPSPNRHLFEIVPRNYFTQKFSLYTPVHTPRPTLVFCLLLFVFSKTSPSELLMDRNERGKQGVLGLGSVVVARVWLLEPLRDTQPEENRKTSESFLVQHKAGFSLWPQGTASTIRGPVLLPAHMTSPSRLSVSDFHTLVAAWIFKHA